MLGSTGSSLSPLQSSIDLQPSSENSVSVTGSPPSLKRRNATYGKKTLGSKDLNLNLVKRHSNETLKQIGKQCELKLKQETLNRFPLTYIVGKEILMVDIIGLSVQSLQIIKNALESKKQFLYFMEELELESLDALGLKQLTKLTLRIHDLSGGTVTRVKRMVNYF